MLKREIKINLKSFIIWTGAFLFMFGLVFLVYPSMSNEQLLDEAIKAMPKELLELFNMDIVSLNSISGWIYTEGYFMLTLIGSIYAAILGSTILLKEENDKTIIFLYSKPISRKKIVTQKLLVGLSYLVLFNIAIAITSLIGLIISNDFNITKWIYLTILPLLLHLLYFVLALFISTFLKKTSKSIMFNLGILLLSYFMQVISSLSSKIDFLKYLSPFYYTNSRTVLKSMTFPLEGGIILIACIGLSLLLYNKYNKKEFN